MNVHPSHYFQRGGASQHVQFSPIHVFTFAKGSGGALNISALVVGRLEHEGHFLHVSDVKFLFHWLSPPRFGAAPCDRACVLTVEAVQLRTSDHQRVDCPLVHEPSATFRFPAKLRRRKTKRDSENETRDTRPNKPISKNSVAGDFEKFRTHAHHTAADPSAAPQQQSRERFCSKKQIHLPTQRRTGQLFVRLSRRIPPRLPTHSEIIV